MPACAARHLKALANRGLDRWGFPLPGWVPPPPKPPRRTQLGPGSFSDERLLPALRRLCAEARHGQRHTRSEIAAACGVDKEVIRAIERAALRRCRALLRKHRIRDTSSLPSLLRTTALAGQ